MNLVCRIVGHKWGNTAVCVAYVPGEKWNSGNCRTNCVRCKLVVTHWYAERPEYIGIPILRHRFAIRHWKVR